MADDWRQHTDSSQVSNHVTVVSRDETRREEFSTTEQKMSASVKKTRGCDYLFSMEPTIQNA